MANTERIAFVTLSGLPATAPASRAEDLERAGWKRVESEPEEKAEAPRARRAKAKKEETAAPAEGDGEN